MARSWLKVQNWAAQTIGRGADEYLITVKGTELPAPMPQVKRSLSVIYAVNPFGADHQSSEHDPMYNPAPEGETNLYLTRLARLGLTDPQDNQAMNAAKVKFALETQKNYSFLDTAGLCQFVWGPAWTLYGPDDEVALIKAVTGWDVSLEEIQRDALQPPAGHFMPIDNQLIGRQRRLKTDRGVRGQASEIH